MDEYPDDHLVAGIVIECLHVMRDYSTITKMAACYNLTERIFRLFSVSCSKESVYKFMDEFHENLKKDLEDSYYE